MIQATRLGFTLGVNLEARREPGIN